MAEEHLPGRDIRQAAFAWFDKNLYPVFAALIAQKRLTPTDFFVYAALCTYDGPGGIFPAVRKRDGHTGGLVERTRLSPATLYRSLRALERLGLIRRQSRHDRKGRRRSNRYDLLTPPKALLASL